MILCPNKNSKAFKSWLKAGISEEDIYTEFVMNNYALPVYSENLTRSLTIPQIESQIKQHEELTKFGIKSIKDLRHAHVNAIGAFYKDAIYYGDKATSKTISEEIGHALLQKFTTPEAHNKVMQYGKELLERRLKKEGKTLNAYLKELQSEIGITKAESEDYAYEEEFMKDFALYNTTGQNAEDLRNIQELTKKFSFLGGLAENIVEFWYNLIKSIKSIFNKAPGQLELIKGINRAEADKYSRGYSKPSYAFMKKGYSDNVSISATAIQLFTNNVIATLQQEIQSNIPYSEFLTKLESTTNTFKKLYKQETGKLLKLNNLKNQQLDNYSQEVEDKIKELEKSKILDYDKELFEDLANYGSVMDYATVDEANTTSLRDAYIEEIRSSLKDLGKKIGQNRISDDNQEDIYTDEDNQILETVGQQYDKSPNEFSPESLSFGLKSIILKTGKVIPYDGFNLVIAPDESHIYSGLVRYTANSYNSQNTFKNLVDFTKNPDNKSTQLFVNDYFLENFITKATYDGKQLTSQKEWKDIISGSGFDISKINFQDSVLAQEFIVLIKSMSLVTRDQETMSLTISENKKKEKVVIFDSFKANLNDAKKRVFTNFQLNLGKLSIKFLNEPAFYEEFMKANGKLMSDEKFIQALFLKSGIRINDFITEKIKEEVLPGNTFYRNIRNKVEDIVARKQTIFATSDKRENEVVKESTTDLNDLLRELAALVVKYDENILDNSFQNMEKKSIYAYQRPTTILKILKQLGSTLDNVNNQDNIWTRHLKNPLQETFSNLTPDNRKKATETFSLDGIFSQEIVEKDGGTEKKRLDEAPFSKMDGRVFGAVILNQMLEKAEVIQGELMFPITLGQNEASNLVDFIKVPYQERQKALTIILQQEIDRHKTAISYMTEFFKDRKEEIKSKEGKIVVTYDELVAYEADKFNQGKESVPIYKGYLEGTYYFNILEDNVDILPNSTAKAFKVSRNLDGVVTKLDLYPDNKLTETVPYETASRNYDKQLSRQYDFLKELGTIDLVDLQIKTGNLKNANTDSNTFKSKLLETAGKPEDSQKQRVMNLMEQFWYGSTFTNQLLLNDPFVAFKNDLKDIAKRRRIYNAAINSVEIPFNVPSLGIKAKKDLTFVVFDDTVEDVFGKNVEVDDGQSYASLNFWLTKSFTKGRLNETKYNLWKRVQAGEIIEVEEVQNNDFYIAVQKTVGSEGHTAIKHAEYTILPIDVADITSVNSIPDGYSFQNGILLPKSNTVTNIYVGYRDGDIEVINKLDSRPDRKELYEKYLIVNGFSRKDDGTFGYQGPIDILTPETTQKGAKPNVINLDKYHANPGFYRQTISASNYGDQLEVPQGHDNIIDPTQNREVKINEYNTKDALKLVEDFIKNETERNEFEVDLMMRSLYGKDYNKGLTGRAELKKDVKDFYQNLQNILKDTGASQQLIDLTELNGEVAKYSQNLPVIRQKFTQILFKMFTKALRHKVSGDTMVQVSKSGHNLIKKLEVKNGIVSWKTVTWEEYKQDNDRIDSLEDLSKLKYDGIKHKAKESTELTDRLLELNELNKGKNIYFVDEVRFMKPYYENGVFKFYTSETLMPRWYKESKDIDPNLKLQYGVRIPTADKQSSVVIEWVGQLSPTQGNSIIVPKEVIVLSGSDFDIDKLFTQRFEGYFKDGKFVKYQNNFDDFLNYMFKNKTQVNFKLNKLKEVSQEYIKITNELSTIKNRVTIDSFRKKEAQISINNLNTVLKQLKNNGEDLINDINQRLKYPSLDQARRNELIATRRVRKVFNDNINDIIINGYEIKDKLTSYNDIEDFDLLDEITLLLNKRDKLIDNIDISGLSIENLFRENVEKQKSYINSLTSLLVFDPQFKELIKKKKEIDKTLKLQVLEDLGYPTNQADYVRENQIYSGVLNNEQLNRSMELLSQEEILGVYLTPSSIQPFKDTFDNFSYTLTSGKQYEELIKKLELKTNDFYVEKNGNTLTVFPFALPIKVDGKLVSKFLLDSDQYQQFTVNNFVKYQNDVKAGKESIGLVANANVLGIFAKRYGVYLNDPIEFEGEIFSEIEFKTLKNKRVFDAIASTISVVVDEAKESQLANHGISVEDLKVMSVLMLHGLDVEDAIAFVQSPGAVKYKDLINRSKIKLETEYKSNEEIIKTHIGKNKNFSFDDKEIRRKELVKYSDTYDTNLESKYILLYERFTRMYNELAETIPIVKIKAGLPTTVEEVEKYQEQIQAIQSEAEKSPDKKMKNYNFDQFVKQNQVKSAMDIINTVNKVGKTELLEMQGIFSTVKKELEDTNTITSNKSDYSRKINELIDKFLLGQKVQEKKPELLERADTIQRDIINTLESFATRLQTQDLTAEDKKTYKETLQLVNRLVKVKDERGQKSIVFAIDGKLSPRLQMQISNAWLQLKYSSPGSIESKFADDLFDYYFLKSGLHWNPGSLEPIFPASKYKEYSDIYEELLTDDTNDLVDKFYDYLFSTPEGTKYLKTVNSFKQLSDDIIFNESTRTATILNDAVTPIAIEKSTQYQNTDYYVKEIFIKRGDTYRLLKQNKPNFVNPMLYNQEVEENTVKRNFGSVQIIPEILAQPQQEVTTQPVSTVEETVKYDNTSNQIEITKVNYTKDTAPNNPDIGFIFTENSQMLNTNHNVSMTQAIIRTDKFGNRNENALPIITKKFQKAGADAQWSNSTDDFETFKKLNKKLIKEIKNSRFKKLVFPQGFATEKAKLPTRFAEWLQTELFNNFGLITELNETKSGLISTGIQQLNPTVTTSQIESEVINDTSEPIIETFKQYGTEYRFELSENNYILKAEFKQGNGNWKELNRKTWDKKLNELRNEKLKENEVIDTDFSLAGTDNTSSSKFKHSFSYKGKEIETEFELSPDQVVALERLIDFYQGKTNTIMLQGPAGVGKTTLIGYLQKYFDNSPILYLAPTHAATVQLALATFKTGNRKLPATVRSSAYYKVFPDGSKVAMLTIKAAKKLGYGKTIVLDEASMLDIQDYNVLVDLSKAGYKLIFLGDQKQIPAVTTNSKAKSVSKAFTDLEQINLDTIHRTSNKTIKSILQNIRDSKVFKLFKTKNTENVQFFNNDLNFNDKILEVFNKYPEDTLLIQYKNTAVESSNDSIRENVFKRTGPVQENDIVIGYLGYESKQIEKGNLANAVPFKVVESVRFNDSYTSGYYLKLNSSKLQDLREKGFKEIPKIFSTNYIPLSSNDRIVHDLTKEELDKNNQLFSNQFAYLLRLLKEKDWRAYSDEIASLASFFEDKDLGSDYIYDFSENKMILLNTKSPKYQELEKVYGTKITDFVVEKGIDFGHAITIHKSQGSTIKNVFFDANSLNKADIKILKDNVQISTENQSLGYVGMSRASENLYVNEGWVNFEEIEIPRQENETQEDSCVAPF